MAVLLAVALFPTLASWLYFVRFGDAPWMRTLYLLAKGVQATLPLIGWLLGMRLHGRPSSTHAVRSSIVSGIASGVLLGSLVALGYASLRDWPPLAIAPARIAARLAALGVTSAAGFLVLSLALAVAHSLFEEYYWRWFLFGQLEQRLPFRIALALASLAFALHHWIVVDSFLGGRHRLDATLPLTLAVVLGGALWCWLFHRGRSLVPSWISHLLVDAALMWVGWRLWAG
jgi:membrane protease YdiL (CAAX protease family)